MTNIYEVTPTDITRLGDNHLTILLNKLLYLETDKYQIEKRSIHVSSEIRQGDGGVDGKIIWDDPNVQYTDFLPNKSTISFQCKQRGSSDFSETDCRKELIIFDKEKKPIEVKPQIEALFRDKGSYILFYNRCCSPTMIDSRLNGFREGLRSVNADYADECDIQIYSAEKISNWVNRYSSAIIFVLECVSRVTPIGMKTWKDWSEYPDYLRPFFSNTEISNKIHAIRNHICNPKKVVRIVGLSGLGKTRLVLEAFRPPHIPSDDITQLQLSEKVVYFESGSQNEISPFIAQWRNSGISGILVVDECDCELHDKLSREIKHIHSNLSLVTIDYVDDCGLREDPLVKLKPSDYEENEIIKQIICESYPDLEVRDIDRIVEFSQGFPQMAALIAKERVIGAITVGTISKRYIIDRLISGRETPSNEIKSVITACSLFSYFELNEKDTTIIQFIAERICSMDVNQFIRIIKKFKKERGIIENRGNLYQVTPKPLAITLALEYWEYCSLAEAEFLLLGKEIPPDLIEPLCKQFQYLNLSPNIDNLIANLCGENRHFGKAEILNSDRGSRIFRSIAKVNPLVAINTLFRCFGHKDKQFIKQIGPGRRNLVWALEDLCFWEKTFDKAAHLMLLFAVSETEMGLGNNATNQFYQIFHILLSGTQTSLIHRLKIIDEGLSTNDSDYIKICITALGHALKSHGFHRISGVERQGSRYPEEDWRPKSNQEVYNYWDEAINRLKIISIENDNLSDLSQHEIEQSIPNLLFYKRLDIIENTVFEICEKKGYYWPEVSYVLKSFLNRNSQKISQENIKRINTWIDKLGPKKILDLVNDIIVHPERVIDDSKEDWQDIVKNKILDFTLNILKTPENIGIILNYLYQTSSSHGYLFGKCLGKNVQDKDEIVKLSIDILKTIPREQRNFSVFSGLLFSLRMTDALLVDNYLETISKDPDLYTDFLLLVTNSHMSEKDLERIITLLFSEKLIVNQIGNLSLGGAISHFDSDVVISFLKKIMEYSSDLDISVFDIAYMYLLKNDSERKSYETLFKDLLINHRCFYKIFKNANKHFTLYEVKEITIQFLKQDKPDYEFAEQIAEEIVQLCIDDYSLYPLHWELSELIQILLSPIYIEKTWVIIGNGIVQNIKVKYNFNDLIRNPTEQKKETIVDLIPLPLLSNWCEDNPIEGPSFLAISISPLEIIKDNITWSEKAKFLIDNYNDNENVLSGLSSNLDTFVWEGSLVPVYEIRLKAFIQLTDHIDIIVRNWAEMNITYYSNLIEKEKNRDEEKSLIFSEI